MTLREFFLVTTQFSLLFPIENFSVTLYRKKKERVRLHAARACACMGARAHFNSNNAARRAWCARRPARRRAAWIWLGELRWCLLACLLLSHQVVKDRGKRALTCMLRTAMRITQSPRSSFLVHFCTAH